MVADPVDRVDQPGVGREIEIRTQPPQGGDDPFEDLGFHSTPGTTLEMRGNHLGTVRRDLIIKERLQDPAHPTTTQPGSFCVVFAPNHR